VTPESPRWVRPLLALIFINLLLALTSRGLDLREVLTGGGDDESDYISAVGALLLLPLLVAVPFVWRHLDRKDAAGRAALVSREQVLGELRSYADRSHEWLWQSDADLRVTWSSRAVSDLLGYTSRQIVGRTAADLLHPDDLATAQALAYRAARTGEGWEDVELRWRHAAGHDVRLEGSGVPVVEGGRVVGFRGARRAARADRVTDSDLDAARTRIHAVVASRDLRVALQPIVDLTTGRLTAVEALARFSDGRGPDAWFADAHLAGAGTDLELLAVEQAVAALDSGALPDGVSLSVNASPSLLLDPRLRAALDPLGTDLRRVTLELTEHAAVTEYTTLHAALAPLRERGMRLAVDDTGAGYASFAHVLRLRPDEVKLDRSLVAGIDEDAARRAVVTAIVILALELGAAVTGEGVETPEELDTLCSLGVDHAQGYHLGRPDLAETTWRSWASRTWTVGFSPHTDPQASRTDPAGAEG
jgi:PAS domain S-box-containing protein